MTPEAKAKELVQKIFDFTDHMQWGEAKELATIFCDEILNGTHIWNKIQTEDRIFWNKVRNEIKKL